MTKKIFILIFLLINLPLWAKTIYMAEHGSDDSQGTTMDSPWRSLKKLQSAIYTLQPGDSILFERGSVFFGGLKIDGSDKKLSNIYVGAYGSGVKPVIKGSIRLDKWTLLKKNIWFSECSADPADLFINGKLQTLGRYPNHGYKTASSSSGKLTLADSALQFPDNFWNNAELVVKTKHWIIDNTPVGSFHQKTFNLSGPVSYDLENNAKYFIQKHIATLDKAGEWYFDKATRRIFLYLDARQQPTDHSIEISVNETGLSVNNLNGIRVENLVFSRHTLSGVRIEKSDSLIFVNNDILFSGRNGLEVKTCKNSRVENNCVADSNNNGVEWHGNENGFFLNNVIERSGIHPGRGSRGNGTYIALNITGDTKEKENKFHRNTIDSTGYLGIDFRTGSTYIRNNFITNFCLIKEDGAGIYTWSNPHGNNVIEGNIIPGRLPHQMSRHDQKSYVHGIYIDDLSKNILVKDNTVAYCPASGIFIHNANHLELKGNTLVGNGDNIVNKEKAQLLIRRDNLAPDSEWDITNLVVNENKFFSLREDQYCIYLNSVKEINLQSIGSFSDNQYVATGAYQVAAQDSNPNSLALCQSRIEMDLKDWQSKFSKDKNSTFDIVRKSREVQNRKNLIKNGDMTANTGGWIVWSERSKAWITHHAKEGMEGPSLKVEINSDGKSDMLLYHGGFGLKRNMIYRLSFAAWSDSKCQIQFVPLMAVSPWKALGDYACFSLDTIRKEYVYYFIPSEENMEARLNFKSSSGFLIDEVILEEITPNVITGEEPITLYYNASSDSKTIRLNGSFMTSEKKPVGNSIVLPGYRTKVLLNQ